MPESLRALPPLEAEDHALNQRESHATGDQEGMELGRQDAAHETPVSKVNQTYLLATGVGCRLCSAVILCHREFRSRSFTLEQESFRGPTPRRFLRACKMPQCGYSSLLRAPVTYNVPKLCASVLARDYSHARQSSSVLCARPLMARELEKVGELRHLSSSRTPTSLLYVSASRNYSCQRGMGKV